MPGILCTAVTLFLIGFLIGVQIAAAQMTTGAPLPITTIVTPLGPEYCPEFCDYNKTVGLSPSNFTDKLVDCVGKSVAVREQLATNAILPVELYENLKNHSLLELSSLLNQRHNATVASIVQCVRDSGKDFKEEEATRHFGFNGTQQLVFDYVNCLDSMKTRNCVDGVYFENVKDVETKLHKDAFTSSFEIVASYCERTLRFDARGAGYNVLPSLSLVVGTALMTTKLAIFNILTCFMP